MCANADACFACAVLGAPPRVPHPYVPAIRSFRGGLGAHAVDDAHGEWSGSSLFPLRSPLPPSPSINPQPIAPRPSLPPRPSLEPLAVQPRQHRSSMHRTSSFDSLQIEGSMGRDGGGAEPRACMPERALWASQGPRERCSAAALRRSSAPPTSHSCAKRFLHARTELSYLPIRPPRSATVHRSNPCTSTAAPPIAPSPLDAHAPAGTP